MPKKKIRRCALCSEPGHYRNHCPNALVSLPVHAKPITEIKYDAMIARLEAMLTRVRETRASLDQAELEFRAAVEPVRELAKRLKGRAT